MQLGRIVGHAVATVKHPSYRGWKLLVAQLVTGDGKPDGEPQLVLDMLGAGSGDLVVLSSDGISARALVKERKSPARWHVIGVVD
jgi:ethanolamine utilization protein EutN